MRFDEIMAWFRLHHFNDDSTPLNVDVLMEHYVSFTVFFASSHFLFSLIDFSSFLFLGKTTQHSSQRH
jgi:hypothetical protein